MSNDVIRVGDRFLVEVEVKSTPVSKSWQHLRAVAIPYNDNGPWHVDLPEGCLLAGKRLPRPLKVGDRVRPFRSSDGHMIFRIIGIDGDAAWLRLDDLSSSHRREELLSDLTPAEESAS